MRKILLFFITLIVCVVSVNAQKIKSSTKKAAPLKVQQVIAPVPFDAQQKLDPQLKSNSIQDNKRRADNSIIKPGTPVTNGAKATTATNTRVFIEITGSATPALVQVINTSGGQILKTTTNNDINVITARVPSASLIKIASSTDVKYIAKASSPLTKTQ